MDYALLGTKPINEKHPAGHNIRDEKIYDELQEELDKFNSPALRDQFEWRNVVGPAAMILKSYSKDLLVACHLGVALTNAHKQQGLIWSTGLLKNILETFWDDLIPVKKRYMGRINAIEYWIGQTELAFDTAQVVSINPEESEVLLQTVEDIKELLESRKEDLKAESIDEVFDFARIINLIRNNTEKKVVQSGPEPTVTVTAGGGEKEKKSEVKTVPEPVSDAVDFDTMNPGEIKGYLSRKFQDIKHLCKKMRTEDPADPMPYKWARMCIWDLLDALPPANDKKTKINAPPQHMLGAMESLYKAEDWKKLLEEAEAKITNPQYIFCLDISRYTAEALLNLGPRYRKAEAVVSAEVLNLVSRFPDIADYEFSKGEPFAGPDTKLWIDELKEAGNESSAPQMFVSEDDSEETLRLNELIAAAKNQDKMNESIAEIQLLIKRCDSMKKAFVSRIGLINVLMNNKKVNAAFPHLEKVLKEIEEFKLEKWEPGLALSGFLLAVKIFNLTEKKECKDRVAAILDKMALIDTKVALNYMSN